ncbi:MAG: PASTA domain-containing protein, partial [Xenococcaceae cyanobacterium]
NTQVESQTTINLVVAKKFDPKEVVGKPDAEATSILKSMGFTVKKTREQIILCAGGNTDSVESGQVTKVEEAADKKVEIFVAQVSVKVPDVKGQKVEAAQKRLTDCSLKVEDSPTQKLILGVPVGEVIGQAPEAESEVDPETTINLEVSGIPPESLTGSWYSNYERQYNWRFVITQQNNSLRSQSVPPCPWFPNIESQGTITIEENELKLVWKVSNDTLIFRGTVTNAAQTGKATKILWNNGVVAQRSLFDPPDLVGEWKGSNNWTYTLSRQGNNAFVYSWTGTGPRDEQLEGELKIKDSNNVALKSSIKDNGRVTHSFEGCVSKVKGDRGQEIKFDNGGVLKRQP